MTLPASGAISLNNVNVELGLSGTTSINMNQATVRTLFAVASGAISMSDGYGKSNTFSFTISSGQTNANLRTLALNAGWPGASKVIATIGSGIYISSNSTGTPALTVNGSFPGGVELINNGLIVGMGGSGGAGRSVNSSEVGFGGSDGSAGGLALSVSVALTLNNAGTIAGGGGGGGGGRAGFDDGNEFGGGGGGGGRSSNAANSAGGAGGTGGSGNGTVGGTGTVSSAGGGGNGGAAGPRSAAPGGAGGNWGTGGSSGSSSTVGLISAGGPFSGGGAGGCITGNSNITYIATGTRLGSIS